MKSFLTYDDANMSSMRRGKRRAELTSAHRKVESLRTSGAQGFFDLPFEEKQAALLIKQATAMQKKFDRLLVIGIGGSDLGARAIWQALGMKEQWSEGAQGQRNRGTMKHRDNGLELHFLSNPDPDAIAAYLNRGSWWKKTAINVVSKSGSTLETWALFLTMREELRRAVGAKKMREHIFVTTDPADNPLRRLAESEHYTLIDHPLTVGGRFSVLSSVGLFPAACAGVDIKKMLRGARLIEEARRTEGSQSLPAQFAHNMFLALQKEKNIHVLMPYAERLNLFAFWYRQLWAESLGKDGKGPTPVAALGAVDQHSQIQLYNEGPNDKVITFIVPNEFHFTTHVPRSPLEATGMEYLSGLAFDRIMHAEHQGTAAALAKNSRPNGTLFIPKINPESLGALFQFFLTATAYLAELLGVNAYNQPGVEAGKQLSRALLTKKP